MDLGVLGTISETSIKYVYGTHSGVSGDLGLSNFLVFFFYRDQRLQVGSQPLSVQTRTDASNDIDEER
jgi:hypothetical protein